MLQIISNRHYIILSKEKLNVKNDLGIYEDIWGHIQENHDFVPLLSFWKD